MLVRLARLLAPAIALLLLLAPLARADIEKFAKHLRKLDPGALVGGKSIVGTKPKQELHGSHGKPNFIVALGDGETIHGASKNDQMGALGKGAKLVPSNHGHSLIVAGPHSEVVVPGQGHNLIFSHAKGATIILKSPGDEVIADGPHDRIVCAKHANHELIEVAKGEKVSKSCKGHHNEIEHLASSSASARSSAATAHSSTHQPVTGNGLDGDPFEAKCEDPSQVDCTVGSFPARTLPCEGTSCFWGHEHVPAYECPGRDPGVSPVIDQPYLLNQNYAPFGTHLDKGVEVAGLGPVGVTIETINDPDKGTDPLKVQTSRSESSATNWTHDHRSYKVILHCTRERTHGYSKDFP